MSSPSSEKPAEAPALDRGLAVLELLAASEGPVRFKPIQRALALNPASTGRLLRTLMARSYVVQEEDRAYRLGPRCQALTGAEPRWDRLRREAEPVLEALVQQTGNTALVFGWSGRHVQSLAKRVHPDAPAMQPVGQVSEWFLGGPWGWIALATMDADTRAEWIRRREAAGDDVAAAVAETERGLGARALAALAGAEAADPDARAKGFVLDDLRVIGHVRRLAAPVRGPRGELMGMVGVGGTAHTLPKRAVDRIGRTLAGHAFTLSVAIGYPPEPPDGAPSAPRKGVAHAE